MNDGDVRQPVNSVDQADDIVDFDLVNGVFTRSAALLISRGYLTYPQVAVGSVVADRVTAFYIYYYDDSLEWMYAVDDSGDVRFVYTCGKEDEAEGIETEVNAVSYREAG